MAQQAETTSPDAALYWRLANESLNLLRKLLHRGQRRLVGGTFALTNSEGIPYFAFQVGDQPLDKQKGRWDRAQEKCLRAALSGKGSSRITRNPTLDRWAGALQANLKDHRYGGFSGLPEDEDEILVADVLVRAGDMWGSVARDYMFHNPHFAKIAQHLDWVS